MSTSLSARLRSDTTAIHRTAERSGIMRDVLGGRLTRAGYVALLRDLLEVYSSLERRLGEIGDDERVARFDLARLAREKTIRDDLTALHGTAWKSELEPTDAAAAYAQRVRTGSPLDVIAHAYVRYLGDLSGGQALRKVIGRQLGLADNEGLSFYLFPAISDIDGYKNQFRDALDSLDISDTDLEGVVSEAIKGFELNIGVFEAVALPSSGAEEQTLRD